MSPVSGNNKQSAQNGKIYSCRQFHYQATQKKGDLKRHQDSVNKGILYQCYECDFQASRENSLKKHKQSKHQGVKYTCSLCDYQATQKSSLNLSTPM